MQISHVTRGEEWISSTPKHVLLYQWLGWELPKFAHFPLLRNENRSKVSKRKNPWATLSWFREHGYLPEALLNFLALMGWSMPDGREIFSLDDFIENVDVRPDQPDRPDLRPEQAGVAERPLHPADVAGRAGGAGAAVPGAGWHRCRSIRRLKRGAAADPGAPEAAGRGAGAARVSSTATRPSTSRSCSCRRGSTRPTAASLLADAEAIVRDVPNFDHASLGGGLRQLAADRGVKTGPAFHVAAGCQHLQQRLAAAL